MRSTTSQQDTDLGALRNSIHFRVDVEDGDASWVDVGSVEGVDWLVGGEYAQGIDQPIPRATVRLRRAIGDLSMATLHETSAVNQNGAAEYDPFLDVGRGIRIYASVLGVGSTPSGGDWQLVFDGNIDRISWQSDPIVITARDAIGKTVASRWVESPTEYGSTAGIAMETVMQSILSASAPGITLYAPTSPGFLITKYEQQEMSVMDALTAIARLIGWEVRVLWDDGTSAFRLTLFEPDRDKTAIDWTWAGNRYFDVRNMNIDEGSVRNAIQGRTPDYSSLATDSASITRFGRKWMLVQLAADSPIDSQSELDDLTAAILADLKDPLAEHEIDTAYFWPAQLGDLYRFSPNAVHYTTAQDWAVTGLRHSFDRESARTAIAVRGKPAGAYLGWLKTAGTASEAEEFETPDFRNFRDRHLDDGTGVRYDWDLNAAVSEVWVFERTIALPETGDNWPISSDQPTRIITSTESQFYETTWPDPGTVKLLQFEPRDVNLRVGPLRRSRVTAGGLSVIIPTVQVKVSSTGNQADIELAIQDPESRVSAVAFKKKSGAGDFDATNPDDGSWARTSPPTLDLTETEVIAAKHGCRIAWAVQYADENDDLTWVSATETWDADDVAEATSVEISFSANGTIVVSPNGDDDVLAMYVTASGSGTPADPTTGSASITGRSGTIDTLVACAPGSTAIVKVRGINSRGELGPVLTGSARRGLGQVTGKQVTVSGPDFTPGDNTIDFSVSAGLLQAAAGASSELFTANVSLPPGVLITQLTVRWATNHASDALALRLMRRGSIGSGAVTVGSASQSGASGAVSESVALAHTVLAGSSYFFELDMSEAGSGGDAQFLDVTLTYTSPDWYATV